MAPSDEPRPIGSRGEPFAPEASASAHLPVGPSQPGWRRFDHLVLGAFVVCLLLPAALLAAGLRPEAIENRPLRTPPAVSAEGLLDGSLAAQVDAYLTDNILVRPLAIRLRGEAIWASGGTGTREVVRGRGDWLFVGLELDPPCRQPLAELVDGLANVAAAFDASGQEFRFVPAPDKHAIYPEDVTVGLRPGACSETERGALRSALARLAPHAIDSWSVLEGARANVPAGSTATPLYFEKDSHWTPTAAIAVMEAMVRSIDPAIWDATMIDRSGTVSYAMDLAALIGIERHEVVARVTVGGGPMMREEVPLANGTHADDPIVRMISPGTRPTLPGRTLIIYDSFFGRYRDMLAPFFADSTWVHVNEAVAHRDLAARLGTFDRVIFERVERYLYVGGYGALLAPFVR